MSRLVSNWLKLRFVPVLLLLPRQRPTLEKVHMEYRTAVRYGVTSVSISDAKVARRYRAVELHVSWETCT